MFESMINAIKPYARLGSIVGKLSAIGVMGYGIKQLWSKEAAEKESLASRAILSSLYLLHMGSVSLTMAVLFGGIDVSAQAATAIVSTTALIKGSAELIKEYVDNAALKRQHSNLQKQLQNKNKDFQRVIAIFEDFKECETEILLLEEERAEIKRQESKKFSHGTNEINEKWQFLKNTIIEKRKKIKTVSDFFAPIDIDNFDVVAALREINAQMSKLIMKRSNKDKDKIELVKLAILNHQLLKFKKIKETIVKLEILKNESTKISSSENDYLSILIQDLKNKLTEYKRPIDPSDYINSNEITDGEIETFLKPRETKGRFLKKHYLKLIQDIDSKIESLRASFNQKQENYKHQHQIDGVDDDFDSMFNDMKTIIELQNQIFLAEFNAASKVKNVYFSMATSVVALLMCAIPSGDFASILNPLMLTVGLAAGASSSIDFFKKYLLKMKLMNNEERKLKRYVQDNSFHAIATITNAELRERLVERLQAVLETKDRVEQQRSKPTRAAKQRAKVLIVHKPKVTPRQRTVKSKRVIQHAIRLR